MRQNQMNIRCVWCALTLGVLLTVPFALCDQQRSETATPSAKEKEPQAVMRDGRPAVGCEHDGWTWYVERVELNGKPAFRTDVDHLKFGRHDKPGTFLVSAERVAYQAATSLDSKTSFDEGRGAVTWRLKDLTLSLDTGQKHYEFFPYPSKGSNRQDWPTTVFPACANFVDLIWRDFGAAEKKFNQLTGRLPSGREAAWHDFQPKAAAWRALATKPPLGEEADRHRILAENALKEKNMDSAIEHYESALEIQPTWPAGWFNLAVLYAEQKNYADATDAMKHYLELAPDASDAQQARDQMIIWEDKAKH